MPRVTKSVTAKANIRRFLVRLKVIMAPEVGFLGLPNSLK